MADKATQTSTQRLSLVAAACLAVAFAPALASAQTDRALWDCSQTICVERAPQIVATLTGTFLYAAELDAVADADRIAALEQQSLREFEFAINEPAQIFVEITLDPDYRPDEQTATSPTGTIGVEALMWRSANGETYARIDNGAEVQPGDLLLIGIRQARRNLGPEAVTYYPARFSATLSLRRLRSDENWDDDPALALPPTQISADADPLPVARTDDAAAIAVEGTANPGNPTAPCSATDCAPPPDPANPVAGSNDLAVELQRELARVGCYAAAIDGLWGPASRRAMTRFNAASASRLDPGQPTARALVVVSQASAPICAEN